MTDERKPLAPDRPGRYELRNGAVITWPNDRRHWLDSGRYCDRDTMEASDQRDIIARAPDDAAWCLA